VNDVLKQRLVGALILLALGVIFWPIIFVQPGDREVAEQQGVPPRPEVPIEPVTPPDQVGLRASPQISLQEDEVITPVVTPVEPVHVEEPVAAPESQPAPAEPPEPTYAARTEAPAPLKMDSDGIPEAWILQVVSVSNAQKADELRRRLSEMNYKADIETVHQGGKTLHRVYLGPNFERAKLEKLKPAIDAEFKVQSMVRRYIP
jgi:DedD protein